MRHGIEEDQNALKKRPASHPDKKARETSGAPFVLRVACGAVAGLVATVLMDAAGTVFWERAMSPDIQKREREIEPRFPLAVLGERIAKRLALQPLEKSGERISTSMHWGIGLACGALHGVISEALPFERSMIGTPVAAGMLAIDEVGFPAAGLCPWPSSFPWQTHARAAFAHLVYGLAMAIFYEGMTSYLQSARWMRDSP